MVKLMAQHFYVTAICLIELSLWMLNLNLLMKVKKYDIEYQPTETTAGHDLLRTEKSLCLKSKDFFYFHTDHLSGYEFNKNL